MLLGEKCLNLSISDFISMMNSKVEGFHSIISQVCTEWIRLEMEARRDIAPFNWNFFAQKYIIRSELGQVPIKLSSILICTCVLMQQCW